MKNPKPPNLADALFVVNKNDPEIVKVFAQSITRLQEIRAKVWAAISLLNFIFLILLPLYALVTAGGERVMWLLIPGIILGFILAATAPKGVA